MELAGALAGDDVDLTAARAAELGQVAAGLHLKLLDRVGRWAQVDGVEGGVRVGNTVQEKVIGVGPVAADANGGWLGRAPVERTHVAGLRSVADVRLRNGQSKVDQLAAIQRQVIDGLGFHHLAETDVLCLQHFGGFHDEDGLALLAEGQGEVETHALAYLEHDAARLDRESRLADLDRIFTRQQIRGLEETLVVGDGLAHGFGRLRFYRNPRAGDGRLRRILNPSTQRREIALRAQRRAHCEQRSQKSEHDDTPTKNACRQPARIGTPHLFRKRRPLRFGTLSKKQSMAWELRDDNNLHSVEKSS